MKTAAVIILTDTERKTLETWSRGRSTPARLVLRAKIVLAAAEGKMNETIAAELATSKLDRRALANSLRRVAFVGHREGRSPSWPNARGVCQDREPDYTEDDPRKPANATHWSTRAMAKAVGVSKDTVQRVWAAHGLKPHLVKTFKVSNDPHFVEKLVDVVGLYLNPPEHALVLCAR